VVGRLGRIAFYRLISVDMDRLAQKMVFQWGGRSVEISPDGGVDCSLRFTDALWGGRAWYVPPMARNPVRWDEWVGSVEAGGSVNFMDLALNPHGQGTHTECLGHITRDRVDLPVAEQPAWSLLVLATVEPVALPNGDKVVDRASLQAALEKAGGEGWHVEGAAVAVRTGAQDRDRIQRQHSRANSPYWTPEAMQWLVAQGVSSLLVEEPSVDREEDGGALEAHRIYWGMPAGETDAALATRSHAVLTELAFFPDRCPDGWCLLNLQLAPLANDAVPSRPLLFPLPQ
jgi:kynurenine formamidase